MRSLLKCLVDLTDSNVLLKLRGWDSWTKTQVHQHLSQPRTAEIRLQDGSLPGASAPRRAVESVQYTNIDWKYLTDGICIVDFGDFFLTEQPPTSLNTPVSFLAPETIFQHKASMASDVWALG